MKDYIYVGYTGVDNLSAADGSYLIWRVIAPPREVSPSFGADAYASMLTGLLPQGAAWPRDPAAVMTLLARSMADALARLSDRGVSMLTEAVPIGSVELLTDWERAAGLPDKCLAEPGSQEERRQALLELLGRVGNQTPGYFIAVAASLGYSVTITEYQSFRVGHSNVGDVLSNGDWPHTWSVNGPGTTVRVFKAGQGSAGDPLRDWGNERLECVIKALKPAHTHVLFIYT